MRDNQSKPLAALIAAIAAVFLTQVIGVDVGQNTKELINAAAPIIAGYIVADDEKWRPKPKLVAAFIGAAAVFAATQWFGWDVNKGWEKLIYSAAAIGAPVMLALLTPKSVRSWNRDDRERERG